MYNKCYLIYLAFAFHLLLPSLPLSLSLVQCSTHLPHVSEGCSLSRLPTTSLYQVFTFLSFLPLSSSLIHHFCYLTIPHPHHTILPDAL